MPFDTTYYTYSYTSNSTVVRLARGGNEEVKSFAIENDSTIPPDSARDARTIDSLLVALGGWPQPGVKQQEHYQPGETMALIFVAILFLIGWLTVREAKKEAEEEENTARSTPSSFYTDGETVEKVVKHRYYGSELNLSGQYCHQSLTKHFPYYASLAPAEQTRFVNRVLKFMDHKIFTIYHNSPFIEMPLLVSATAIQLSFGLKRYLLQHFDHIHIYPQEFMRVEPVLCFLEGNVSGHRINLSWKHFLEGLQSATDGKNVGLHEMAHALHYQTFVVEQYADRNFRDRFDEFSDHGNKVYNTEMISDPGLYSEYAMTNFQEFWAESVEIFFERPAEMNRLYPHLYAAISEVLNQDPLRVSA